MSSKSQKRDLGHSADVLGEKSKCSSFNSAALSPDDRILAVGSMLNR
jgi:hypothetical protein